MTSPRHMPTEQFNALMAAATARRCVELKARYPRIDDPVEAINFALDDLDFQTGSLDFLETWREGAWEELRDAYPEFLKQVDQ